MRTALKVMSSLVIGPTCHAKRKEKERVSTLIWSGESGLCVRESWSAYAAADPRDERDIDHKDRASRPRVDKEEVLAANILDGGERQLDAQQEQAVQPEEEHHKRLGEFEGDEC